MSDYRVTVKVRNARLLRAINNAGFTSVKKFSEQAGVTYMSVCELINMTASPLRKDGGIRIVADSIMDFLCEPFDALFTPEQCNALSTNKSERDVSAEQVFAIMSSASDDNDPLSLICESERRGIVENMCEEVLSKNAVEVIKERFGFDDDARTLDDVGAKRDVTRERIRQIEVKSISRLREHIEKRKISDMFRG